jgi:hypothetical protein
MSVTDSCRGDLERRAWRSVFQDGLWDIAPAVACPARLLKLHPKPNPEVTGANS